MIAKKGERVTCPRCKAVVAELAEDLHSGMMIESHLFIERCGHARQGEQMICRDCGAWWFDAFHQLTGGRIHMEDGWRP